MNFIKLIFFISLFLNLTSNQAYALHLSKKEWKVGEEISVTGEGFGLNPGTHGGVCFNDNDYCFWNNSSGITFWSDKYIRFFVPSNIPISGQIIIYKTSERENCNSRYCYLETFTDSLGTKSYSIIPEIINISKDKISKDDIITINGYGFGDNPGEISTNGEVNINIIEWTTTNIAIQIESIKKYSDKIIISNRIGHETSYNIEFLSPVSKDEYSEMQTYLTLSDVPPIWDQSQGKEVVVAVIDSGVNTNHKDLVDSFWINKDEIPYNDQDDDNNGYIDDYYGYNFAHKNSELTPANDHGTMVAGIIAAKRDNEIGIAGIAPKAKIMVLQIAAHNDGIKIEDITEAIKYAADNGADIINLSLGGPGFTIDYTDEYDEAIKYAYNKGLVLVAAAGNGDATYTPYGRNLDLHPNSPVCNDNKQNMVLGVGSVNNKKEKSNFSDFGKCIDISALGEEIISLSHPAFSSYGEYNIQSGTSFSAPQVSAAAAILKSHNPILSNWEIYKILIESGLKLDSYNQEYQEKIGTLLNLSNAMNYAASLPKPVILKASYKNNILKVTGKYFTNKSTLEIKYKTNNNKYRSVSFKTPLKTMSKIEKKIILEDLNADEIGIKVINYKSKSSKIFSIPLPNTEKKSVNNSSEKLTLEPVSETFSLEEKAKIILAIPSATQRLKTLRQELKNIKNVKDRIKFMRTFLRLMKN